MAKRVSPDAALLMLHAMAALAVHRLSPAGKFF